MIFLPAGTRIWLAAGATDMRRGMDGLAALVQSALAENPFSGHVFLFRGWRGDLIKVLWWSGDDLCLFVKRLERGRFIWPQAAEGAIHLSVAQLSMLLEGIDWRRPVRTAPPVLAASNTGAENMSQGCSRALDSRKLSSCQRPHHCSKMSAHSRRW